MPRANVQEGVLDRLRPCRSGRGGRAGRWSRRRRAGGRARSCRRSRRPRRRRPARCRGGRSCRVSVSSPPIANDGSTPACCRATVSIDVVVVLPLVPATATRVRPCITANSACERWMTRRPALARRDDLGVGRPDRAGDDDGLGAAEVRRRRGRSRPVAPSARSAVMIRESLASLPLTGSPRASSTRAMPGHAGAADADEVHPAEQLGRRDVERQVDRERHRSSSLAGQRLRAVRRPARPGRRPARRASRTPQPAAAAPGRASAPAGSASQARAGARAPTPASSSLVRDEQAATGRHDRLGVEPLLAVADRQRHVDRRAGRPRSARRRCWRRPGRRRRRRRE